MSIYYEDPQATIYHGDCRQVMSSLRNGEVDSIVTDPPYDLKDGTAAGGFMGKEWDDTRIAFNPEVWAEALRVLKPGGHLLAFGAPRTWHRLAVAVEDAGFEIKDGIAWLYGSGFPKRKTALKPAFEPILIARKPFKGPLIKNQERHGTGALNVDACRIGEEERSYIPKGIMPGHDNYIGKTWTSNAAEKQVVGRWPANVVLDENMAAVLDERTDNASRFFYAAKAPKSERPSVEGVSHPTVKPLSLMEWLVKLVTPEGGTVLDPFAGSGTTLEASLLGGFRGIAIENETEYLPLIRSRVGRVRAAELAQQEPLDIFGGAA